MPLYDEKGSAIAAAAFWTSLRDGMRIAVFYKGDPVWHERRLLSHDFGSASHGVYMIETPDGDRYEEDVLCQDPEGPSDASLLNEWGRPAKAGPKSFYRFAGRPALKDCIGNSSPTSARPVTAPIVEEPSPGSAWVVSDAVDPDFGKTVDHKDLAAVVRKSGLTHDGRYVTLMAVERAPDLRANIISALGLGPAAAPPSSPQDHLGRRLDAVLAGDSLGPVGAGAETGAGASAADSATALPAGKPPQEDIRTLWVDFDEQGERVKNWCAVCGEMFEANTEHWRRHHDGPLGTLDLCKELEREGGCPRRWFDKWCRDAAVNPRERSGIEMRSLTEVLYMGGAIDQLNLPALASFEMVTRRISQLVEAY